MRNILIPAVTLIIGILIGYAISSYRQPSFTERNFTLRLSKVKSPIDSTLASKMRREFRKDFNGHGLRAGNKKPLKGFYVDRQFLDTLLKDPYCEGISFYFGKNLETNDKSYMLMFNAAKTIEEPIKRSGASMLMYRSSNANARAASLTDYGEIYDHVDPCPDRCGDSE